MSDAANLDDLFGPPAPTLRGFLMCPNCGWLYKEEPGLVPDHELEFPTELCPGSRQCPRNPETDRRPLWNRLP